MEVTIHEVTSTVRTVDGDTLLAPETLQKIVRVALEAMREQEAHRERVQAEQQVTGSVREAYVHHEGGQL